MATIPGVAGPSVRLTGLPDGYQRAPAALGAAGETRARQLGQGADLLGAAAQVERDHLEELDRVRVDDAINQLKERQLDLTFGKEAGFTNQRGLAALQRASGRPLADEYAEQLQRTASTLTNGLGNERQRRLFGLQSNNIVTGFHGQVMRYEGEQADAYGRSVREGVIANRQNEVGLFYNDPARISEALGSIEASSAELGRRQGLAAQQIGAVTLANTSKAVVGAVQNALERNDFVGADALMKMFGDKMTAADMVRARSVVDKQFDAGVAMQQATAAMRQVQPLLQPSEFDRVVGITVQSESGGNPAAVSPKGAKGVMQVLDGTNRDPGFGVTPARDDSPAERARVGRDYLAAMVKRYDGNLAQAWAAYNAGPGAVDEAIDKASSPDMAKRGKFGQWLSLLPGETQAYVQKNLAAYQAGEGAPARPSLQEVHNTLRQRIGDGNPARLKLALDEATRQYDEALKAIKQREDEGTANAQRWLAGNGGRFALMPASLRAAVPPGQVDNLLNFSDRVARGEDRTNPAVYQRLSDTDFLRGLSENEFYVLSTRELSEADRKHFAAERGRLLTGAASDKPGDLNSGAIKSTLDARLRELGIDPTPKDDGGTDAARVGAIRQFVDRSILSAQAAAGKKFTDEQVAKHIDGLMAQTDVASGWFSDKSVPMLSMKAGDIPSAVRDRLKTDFKAAGIDDPTDGQILSAYWLARSAARQVKKIVPLQAAKPAGQ